MKTVALAWWLIAGASAATPLHASEVRSEQPAFQELRQHAFRYIGRPYVMGGNGNPAFDCSGFVVRVFGESGYGLPRTSRQQARVGRPVPLDAIEPGDLLFFASRGRPIRHVAIYLGDDEVIHASSRQGRVAIGDLSARWFRKHLVSARRILGSARSTRSARMSGRGPVFGEVVDEDALEGSGKYAFDDDDQEEHGGNFRLVPMLRLEASGAEPNFGPALTPSSDSAVSARVASVSEDGGWGMVAVPEISLVAPDWGFELTGAAVVRFAPGESPTVGSFRKTRDYFRLLRTVRLGLPGADVEAVASRLGDLTLGSGVLVDHATPGTTVRGVPGLTVGTSPLSSTLALRGKTGFVRGILDDVFDPQFVGGGGGFFLKAITLGFAVANDRAALWEDERRSIYGAEAYLVAELVDWRSWSVALSTEGRLHGGLADAGWAADARLKTRVRLSEADAISLEAYTGYLGPQSLRGLFGPTYLAHRAAHLDALSESGRRYAFGGEVRFDYGKWRLMAGYGDSSGDGAVALDRTVRGMVAVEGLALGATRLVDLRAVYVARAFGDRSKMTDVAQVALRVRFNRWLSSEAYFQLGEGEDGGGGLTLQWLL